MITEVNFLLFIFAQKKIKHYFMVCLLQFYIVCSKHKLAYSICNNYCISYNQNENYIQQIYTIYYSIFCLVVYLSTRFPLSELVTNIFLENAYSSIHHQFLQTTYPNLLHNSISKISSPLFVVILLWRHKKNQDRFV